jgi:hypothetical protein
MSLLSILDAFEELPPHEHTYLSTVLQCSYHPTVVTEYSFDILWHLNHRHPVCYYKQKLYSLPKISSVNEVLEILNLNGYVLEIEWSYHLQNTDISEFLAMSIENLTLTAIRLYRNTEIKEVVESYK